MHLLLTIVAFIVIFSILILIHEAGHFFAAKRAGVKVEEFGFGLPPRMFGVKKGETLYSFNWIPFGGFVRMLGEDDGSKEAQTSKRSYSNQPFRIQAWIVCAGVLMNLLLSFVLLTIGFWVGIEPLIATEDDFLAAVKDGTVHVEMTSADDTQALYLPNLVYRDRDDSILHEVLQSGDVLQGIAGVDGQIMTADDLNAALEEASAQSDGTYSLLVYRPSLGASTFVTATLPVRHPLITYVEDNSPAAELGLQPGDEIESVAGQAVHSAEQVVTLTQAADASIEYVVLKEGSTDSVTLTIPLREDGRVGVSLTDPLPYYGNLSFYPSYVPYKLLSTDKVQYGWSAPVVAVQEMWRLGKMTAGMFVNVLKQFVTAQGVPDGVSGPVGIAQMTGITITQGWAAMLRFVALLSLSLGVINILPFPALDGGHFALILLKAVSGKKRSYRWEHVINLGGFLFLLVFILYITFNDVVSLF